YRYVFIDEREGPMDGCAANCAKVLSAAPAILEPIFLFLNNLIILLIHPRCSVIISLDNALTKKPVVRLITLEINAQHRSTSPWERRGKGRVNRSLFAL